MIALAELNAATFEKFVATLDGIFEHSPWIAERAAVQQPFASRLDLLEALCAAMNAADRKSVV